MNAKDLAKQIEATYQAEMLRPFPGEDFHKLYAIDPTNLDLFRTYFDLFCSDVAGYASSARRFLRKTSEENESVRNSLLQSFFEAYPEYAKFEPHITRSATPQLFDEMQTVEKVRLQLIALFNLLEGRDPPPGFGTG